MNSLRPLCFLLFIFACLPGCSSEDPAITAARSRYVVTAPPAGEQPIPEVHRGLNESTLQPDAQVTVRARINAGDFPPFAEGQAAFVVTDATNQDGDETHNPHECPFCKRDIEVQMARVQFTDESGKTLKLDARQLFNLKEFDLVVVEGAAKFDEDKSLIINARKLFVKR